MYVKLKIKKSEEIFIANEDKSGGIFLLAFPLSYWNRKSRPGYRSWVNFAIIAVMIAVMIWALNNLRTSVGKSDCRTITCQKPERIEPNHNVAKFQRPANCLDFQTQHGYQLEIRNFHETKKLINRGRYCQLSILWIDTPDEPQYLQKIRSKTYSFFVAIVFLDFMSSFLTWEYENFLTLTVDNWCRTNVDANFRMLFMNKLTNWIFNC